MKSYLRTTCLFSLALLMASFQLAAAAPAEAEDVAAIKSLFDKHTAAFSAGEATAVASLFTDDAVLLAPDREALAGKQMIQWGANIAFQMLERKITGGEVLEVEVAGDWAFARRTSEMTLTSKFSGEVAEFTATWLEILKRQPDGLWKIYRASVTSDTRLPDFGE